MIKIKELLEKECLTLSTKSEIPYSLIFPLYNRIREKEIAHSEIIRELLDTKEKHNHGNEFFNLFLKDIGLTYNSSYLTDIKIETEYPTKVTETSNNRPIDILITYQKKGEDKKYAIIIENKLNYAIDQYNQINDYNDGLIREGYKIEKIVYMHIDLKKTIASTDTRNEFKKNTINYNVLLLINTLSKMKTYSYIVEYKNLLQNLSQSYMPLIKAKKIQTELNNDELEKLIEISNLVNSYDWYKAKHKRIEEKLNEKFNIEGLKSDFDEKNYSYSRFWLANYKFWAEVWYYQQENKLYLCSNKDKEKIICEEYKYVECGDNYDGWFYEKKQGNIFKYPSENDNLIKELSCILENSIK